MCNAFAHTTELYGVWVLASVEDERRRFGFQRFLEFVFARFNFVFVPASPPARAADPVPPTMRHAADRGQNFSTAVTPTAVRCKCTSSNLQLYSR